MDIGIQVDIIALARIQAAFGIAVKDNLEGIVAVEDTIAAAEDTVAVVDINSLADRLNLMEDSHSLEAFQLQALPFLGLVLPWAFNNLKDINRAAAAFLAIKEQQSLLQPQEPIVVHTSSTNHHNLLHLMSNLKPHTLSLIYCIIKKFDITIFCQLAFAYNRE